MADRRWMYLDNRTCEEYLSGLKSFFSAAEADKLNRRMSALCCPCIDCENVRKFSSSMHAPLLPACRGFPSFPLRRAPRTVPLPARLYHSPRSRLQPSLSLPARTQATTTAKTTTRPPLARRRRPDHLKPGDDDKRATAGTASDYFIKLLLIGDRGQWYLLSLLRAVV